MFTGNYVNPEQLPSESEKVLGLGSYTDQNNSWPQIFGSFKGTGAVASFCLELPQNAILSQVVTIVQGSHHAYFMVVDKQRIDYPLTSPTIQYVYAYAGYIPWYNSVSGSWMINNFCLYRHDTNYINLHINKIILLG